MGPRPIPDSNANAQCVFSLRNLWLQVQHKRLKESSKGKLMYDFFRKYNDNYMLCR